jgi:hypothetical protein
VCVCERERGRGQPRADTGCCAKMGVVDLGGQSGRDRDRDGEGLGRIMGV